MSLLDVVREVLSMCRRDELHDPILDTTEVIWSVLGHPHEIPAKGTFGTDVTQVTLLDVAGNVLVQIDGPDARAIREWGLLVETDSKIEGPRPGKKKS